MNQAYKYPREFLSKIAMKGSFQYHWSIHIRLHMSIELGQLFSCWISMLKTCCLFCDFFWFLDKFDGFSTCVFSAQDTKLVLCVCERLFVTVNDLAPEMNEITHHFIKHVKHSIISLFSFETDFVMPKIVNCFWLIWTVQNRVGNRVWLKKPVQKILVVLIQKIFINNTVSS